MDHAEREERDALYGEMSKLREEFEANAVPEIIESMLSLRLTMQQLKVLTLLIADEQGGTVQKLAQTLEVSLATISGIVDRLESQQMVERLRDPNDHRVRRVVATPAGREVIQRLMVARPEGAQVPLDRLSLDDLRAFTQGLRALMLVMRNSDS